MRNPDLDKILPIDKKIEKNKTVDEVIEDIQLAQVEAGGKFLRQIEIRKMTVEELLNLLIPNNVCFIIKRKVK